MDFQEICWKFLYHEIQRHLLNQKSYLVSKNLHRRKNSSSEFSLVLLHNLCMEIYVWSTCEKKIVTQIAFVFDFQVKIRQHSNFDSVEFQIFDSMNLFCTIKMDQNGSTSPIWSIRIRKHICPKINTSLFIRPIWFVHTLGILTKIWNFESGFLVPTKSVRFNQIFTC